MLLLWSLHDKRFGTYKKLELNGFLLRSIALRKTR